jgi:transposase
MKTVKIKVTLTPESEHLIAGWLKELEWLWNQARRVALHNHCLEWYGWAAKKAKDKEGEFYGVDLEGITPAPLRLSKRGAWMGAACQIAVGGPYFAKDEKAPPIAYREKGKIKYKPAAKLVKGDRPYERVKIEAYSPIAIDGTPLKRVMDLDRMGQLNKLRGSCDLPPLTVSSDYVGGLLKDFETSWKAYLDSNLPDRKQPLFKDGREGIVATLNNAQNPPRWKEPKKGEPHFYCAGGIQAVPCDKHWRERMGVMVPRSYKLNQKPSGWYLCISVATEAEALGPTLKARKTRRSSELKKLHKGLDKTALDAVRANDPDFQKLTQDVADLEALIEIEAYENSPCRKTTGRTAGIDPGVKAIVATSEGHLFRPNYRRDRVKARIGNLQRRLDVMRNCNDKRQGKAWKKGERDATQNEARLQQQVKRLHERSANMSNAFNHKLSTRLARMFDGIGWENTQLGNMKGKAKPVLHESGQFYEQNNGAAKTGLNESLSMACIGDLKAKTRAKMLAARKRFEDSPAAYSSLKCHACGEAGERAEQESFYCRNDACEMHDIWQQADINAATNHKKVLAFPNS